MTSNRPTKPEPMASPPTELDVLGRLHDLNTFMGSSIGDMQQLLDRLLNDLMELHNSDFGCIQLYDPVAKVLRIASYRGFKASFLDRFADVDGDTGSACGMAMKSGHRVIVEDVEKDPSFAPSLGIAREAGFRSVQATPMHGALGELVGMISTHAREPRKFTQRELWLTDLYARQAGFAVGAKQAGEALQREQQRQSMLFAELQHRVRNTLAVIRSIVRRTALTSGNVEEFEHHLDGRIGSFARTQSYVTRDLDKGVDLELIIRDELLAHASSGSHNVSIEGPGVRLTAKQAETLGLAIHELTSNAIKHGALAEDGNKLQVKWSVSGEMAERRLHFSWLEKLRGRALKQPARQGFGTELLDKILSYELDAEPEIEFRPEGLSYRVAIPLQSAASSH